MARQDRVRRVTIMSEAMHDVLGEFAASQRMSMNEVVLQAVAQYIGYDLDLERRNRTETRGRPKKYHTPEQRKEAARERARRRNLMVKAVIADVEKQDRLKAVEALQSSLERRGKL